jgi:hypothetical protein
MKATPKQRATLDSMQIQYDDEITVESASELIAALTPLSSAMAINR